MIVAGVEERIVGASGDTSMMHAHWASMPRPTPPAADVQFALRPGPRWTFRTAEHAFERAVLLQRAGGGVEPALLLQWKNLGTRPLRLLIRPLLGCNDADHLPPAHDGVDATVQARGASWGFRPNRALPVAWLTVDGIAAFRSEAAWYRGFLYATDRARGYDHVGDRWSPGVIELDLPPGGRAVAAWSLGEPCGDPHGSFERASALAADHAASAEAASDTLRARLELGADDFLYECDGSGATSAGVGRLGVLAGFPWFSEWGRDVFVSLPGLTLPRGRLDLCERVLTGALPFLQRGLLPNVYGTDAADSHYDSCDAALWFALAVQRYASSGGDAALVRERLVPALRSIADAYVEGTELGLRTGDDGLLFAGRDDLNATWMDARTAGGPVTPRTGQPVEIQALWYSLLGFLVEQGDVEHRELFRSCGKAFVQRFWIEGGDYLADRVHAGAPDATVRPNMVIAAALPLSPLTQAQRGRVVAVAREELLTPRGLRTLTARDPAYRGRYEGGPEERDLAYHQGTVWPWLGGFYVEAALRAATRQKLAAVRSELRAWLLGFAHELDRAGLDHVSEVFDGDAPHRPGGTFAQAWNTGELLRALALLDAPPAAVLPAGRGERR
jgi:predicted glycogen debranching enzyme